MVICKNRFLYIFILPTFFLEGDEPIVSSLLKRITVFVADEQISPRVIENHTFFLKKLYMYTLKSHCRFLSLASKKNSK